MNFFDVPFNEETQFSLLIFYSIFNQTCTFFFFNLALKKEENLIFYHEQQKANLYRP